MIRARLLSTVAVVVLAVVSPVSAQISGGGGGGGTTLVSGGYVSGNLFVAASTLTVSGPLISTGTMGNVVFAGAGTRFMWVPSSSSIRAGGVSSTQWDPTQVGGFSAAFGHDSTANASYATVGGGDNNASAGASSVISGGQNNSAAAAHSAVSGGRGNTANSTFSGVGGGDANYASGSYSRVGGGLSNYTGTPDQGSTVSGGTYDTVGGGNANYTYQGTYNTIAGGRLNTIVGGGIAGVIAGGQQNAITGSGSNYFQTIAGGVTNSALGYASMVPGGENNTATGNYSFAAGRRAQAANAGSFVWADGTNANYFDSAANTFNARATSGFNFNTGTSSMVITNTAVTLAPTQDLNMGGGGAGSVAALVISSGANTGVNVTGWLSATAAINFGATGGNACQDATVAVSGAADGDDTALGAPVAVWLTGLSYYAFVSSADVVSIRTCCDLVIACADPPSATFRVTVWKH